MSTLPAILQESGRFLRRVLITNWIQTSVLLSAVLVTGDVLHHQRRMINNGDHTIQMVAAALRTPMTLAQRQTLVETYAHIDPPQLAESINAVLVIDPSGRIIYSSRSAWRGMKIQDPQFDLMEGDDPDFRAVLECFRNQGSDCMEMSSEDWHIHFDGITVVRPLLMPATDLGLERQRYLAVVNFDAGMLVADIVQDIPLLIVAAILIAGLHCGGLALILSGRLLPQLIETTQTDNLTQLMNRTSFMELAMDLLADGEERGAELVFAILDIDQFKRINDTYGHGCGDAALSSVGSLLITVTRPDDLVCRFGGEEFAMLLSVPKADGAKALERLRLQIEMNQLLYNGHRIPMTASIGAAATGDCGYNLDFLYNAADKALYAAKHEGRNRLRWNVGELLSRLPQPLTPHS
ncbi:MAG: diguanylate cyclase [Synechococcaceae cyanobacterium]|nr:diguanylate cyclase [Synechococcaceae cyanobacterium]